MCSLLFFGGVALGVVLACMLEDADWGEDDW